jgi:NAD(P)-dependent dehydrogenase (short-subunit alcohol dehydrogenase family)
VHAVDRDGQTLQATTTAMWAQSLAIRSHTADATDEAALCKLRDHIREEHGRVDILRISGGVSSPLCGAAPTSSVIADRLLSARGSLSGRRAPHTGRTGKAGETVSHLAGTIRVSLKGP